MRKLLLATVALSALTFGNASAEKVETPVGTVTVNEGGYVVIVDGDAANPDPVDGFVSVREDGQVCADDNGTADDGNPDNGPESATPTCSM